MKKNSFSYHRAAVLVVFHTVGILVSIQVTAAADCSLKKLPEVSKMARQMPVIPYDIQRSSSPVQGLHLALAGDNSLRATWMTPAFLQGQVSSPGCVYAAATMDEKQRVETVNGQRGRGNGKGRVHSAEPHGQSLTTGLGDRGDGGLGGHIALQGPTGGETPRRRDDAQPDHTAERVGKSPGQAGGHHHRSKGISHGQPTVNTRGQPTVNTHHDHHGRRFRKRHAHHIGHGVEGQVTASGRHGNDLQRSQGFQGQIRDRRGQYHNQELQVGNEIPSFGHKTQALGYDPNQVYNTIAVDTTSQEQHADSHRLESTARQYSYSAGGFSDALFTAVMNLTAIPCSPHLPAALHCVRAITYQCGDRATGLSDVMHVQLHATPAPRPGGPQIAVVADLGLPSGLKTMDAIAARISEAPDTGVAMLFHAGDIAYADCYNRSTADNSWVWVDYMQRLQAVASRVPYMTAPGNHEAQFHFAAYLSWLPMPHAASNSTSPFWFSFQYLGVHFLSFSTEHDFGHHSEQRRWMEADLKSANENRRRVPWVVVIGHRPLYCSSVMCHKRCHHKAARYRSHLEDLLYQQRVDVVLAGHNHQYERSFPVYQGRATQRDYVNPAAPVYVVNGAGGNPEILDPTFEPGVEWRAWYQPAITTGFLIMTPSASRLRFDYVLSDSNTVVDSFTIVRN